MLNIRLPQASAQFSDAGEYCNGGEEYPSISSQRDRSQRRPAQSKRMDSQS